NFFFRLPPFYRDSCTPIVAAGAITATKIRAKLAAFSRQTKLSGFGKRQPLVPMQLTCFQAFNDAGAPTCLRPLCFAPRVPAALFQRLTCCFLTAHGGSKRTARQTGRLAPVTCGRFDGTRSRQACASTAKLTASLASHGIP